MMHPISHFKKIHEHRRLVRDYCFRLGLYRQGLLHDLSKYSPAEFWWGAIYYSGEGSPIAAERKARGSSSAWLHHKGRNKHHTEYWTDYSYRPDGTTEYRPLEMPGKYVAEMFCDHLAACKVYKGKSYTDSSPLEHYLSRKDHKLINPETDREFEKMLRVLSEKGEEEAFRYVREWLYK